MPQARKKPIAKTLKSPKKTKSARAPVTKTKSQIGSVSKKSPKFSKPKETSKKTLAPIIDINGRAQGTMELPKEVFGQKPNSALLAQAIRVYAANSSTFAAHTKTRAEVRGGGAKPWRQKGTGRARAGSSRSPLWVGGGVAHGPKTRKQRLTLPKKMRRKALLQALSSKLQTNSIYIVSNLEKIEPKTKIIASLLSKINQKPQRTLLIISQDSPLKTHNVKLATRNIPHVTVSAFENLNAYEIIKYQRVLFSKEAIPKSNET